MKLNLVFLTIGLTISAHALPDYTVFYSGPMDEINQNTPEEIAELRLEIKKCTLSYKTEAELDHCIKLDKSLHKNNPYM